jgi:hypothetical protein
VPVIDDAELPIRKTKISGPAVDAFNSRKESDDAAPMTSERLLDNYRAIKDSLIVSMKKLALT